MRVCVCVCVCSGMRSENQCVCCVEGEDENVRVVSMCLFLRVCVEGWREGGLRIY